MKKRMPKNIPAALVASTCRQRPPRQHREPRNQLGSGGVGAPRLAEADVVGVAALAEQRAGGGL